MLHWINLDDSGGRRGLLLIVLCRFSAVVGGWRVAVLPDVLGPAPTAPGRPPSGSQRRVAGQPVAQRVRLVLLEIRAVVQAEQSAPGGQVRGEVGGKYPPAVH